MTSLRSKLLALGALLVLLTAALSLTLWACAHSAREAAREREQRVSALQALLALRVDAMLFVHHAAEAAEERAQAGQTRLGVLSEAEAVAAARDAAHRELAVLQVTGPVGEARALAQAFAALEADVEALAGRAQGGPSHAALQRAYAEPFGAALERARASAEVEAQRAEALGRAADARLTALAVAGPVALGAVLVVLGLALMRPLLRRVRALGAAAEALQRHEWEGPLPVPGDARGRTDELGRVTAAFNAMAETLTGHQATLRDAVQHRTEELAAALEETARGLQELKDTQARLVMADRLAALGTLAAGVGHEVNNPLSYLQNNLQFLEVELRALLAAGDAQPSEARAKSHAELLAAATDAADAVRRIADIARGLKSFSRMEEARHPVALGRVLEGATKLARGSLRRRAQLEVDVAPGTPPVLGSEGRLGQVFLNLLVNAAQAIPEGDPERHAVRVRASADARGWAVVEVEDTGCGMTPELQARIFEPFFTTKPQGVGTGLGLAICKELVDEAGGRLSVTSAPGQGSTFRVELPPAPPAQAAAAAARGRARVLVVDADPRVADAVRRAMGAAHDVVAVALVEAALALVRAGQRFDLILCDLPLEGDADLQARDALARAAAGEGDPVVFMSDREPEGALRAFLEAHPHRWLPKPFLADLARVAVRDALS